MQERARDAAQGKAESTLRSESFSFVTHGAQVSVPRTSPSALAAAARALKLISAKCAKV